MSKEAEKRCPSKHTKYQPTVKEWRCPKCKADHEHFTVYDPAQDADPDCGLTHNDDSLCCTNCEGGWSGKVFAAGVQKANGLVPCAHCEGSGLVKAAKP